jgi:hypothetical protein
LLRALKREFGFYCIEMCAQQMVESEQRELSFVLGGEDAGLQDFRPSCVLVPGQINCTFIIIEMLRNDNCIAINFSSPLPGSGWPAIYATLVIQPYKLTPNPTCWDKKFTVLRHFFNRSGGPLSFRI